MQIISDELKNMIFEMSKNNDDLLDMIQKSQSETCEYSVYKNNRYKTMLANCLEELKSKLKEHFESKEELPYKDFLSNIIPDIISSNMPEYNYMLFEMAMDNDFNMNESVDYELPNDNLAIHVRSFLDESFSSDLYDEADKIWDEIINKEEE